MRLFLMTLPYIGFYGTIVVCNNQATERLKCRFTYEVWNMKLKGKCE